MKPASRDAIIGEMERLFMRAGSKDYDSAMAIIEKLLKRAQEAYHPMRSKVNFAATLDSLPEPSWLEMRYILRIAEIYPAIGPPHHKTSCRGGGAGFATDSARQART